MIPTVLHRCVPEVVPPRWEDHWTRWCGLHPGWGHITWRDRIDPTMFPRTAHVWDRCRAGAALAGLVRLEALADLGGVFLDWDVRPCAPLHPLLAVPGGMFAAWEDDDHVPDAVFGCEAHHPAVEILLAEAVARTAAGASVWECSVGLFTEVLPGRDDVTLLPRESFYPVHYGVERAHPGSSAIHEAGPATYGVHEWAWSWQGQG